LFYLLFYSQITGCGPPLTFRWVTCQDNPVFSVPRR